VGLRTERSLETVVGLIGILKAGGAYLPIDTAYPKDRVGFMLEDARVRVLLTQAPLLASLAESQARVVCLDTEWGAIARESTDNLSSGAGPDSLAYVIYTSGSTGKPKGCLVTHYNVVRLMQATDDWYRFHEGDVWTLFHSHAFDFSVWEIWGALLYGGRLVVVPYWVSRSPDLFHQLLREQRVTVLNQTPSAFRQLIQADETAGDADLALRLVIFGGEALELESLRPWFDRHGDARPQLVNMYGITETTVHVTYRPLSFEDVREGRGSVIGGPIPDLSLFILDSRLQPAPVGVAGEICVGGAGVARGYLDRPELTRERFIDDPFSTESGARLYRSGDLARRLANGDIEYLGRIDQQVKIRGFRVELGEIETSLAQHPGVKECVVTALADPAGDKRLVAYMVASPEARPDAAGLRQYLKKKLPDYMVPSAFVLLDRMPLTDNGKIDRKALPAPARGEDASSPSGTYVAPRTETERTLVEIFLEVLGTRQVGIDDDFFDLGGHSLTAMRAISLIKSKLNAELPVRVLFRAKTVSQIAAYIAERDAGRTEQSSEEWSTCIPIQPGGSKVPLFCVARPNVNALGYLFLSRRLGPDQPVYGLQRQMPEDPQVDFTPEQIRATAEEYIRVMRSIQPRGPYFLVGQCQGAYIAFEMTRQLESQGERVGMLGMLDVWPEENTRYKTLFFANLYARKLLRLLRRKVATAAATQPPPTDIKPADGSALAPAAAGRSGNPQWRIYWPGPGFKPAVVASRIVVFPVASQAFYRKRDKAMGWRNRTRGGVEVEEIPGDHITFLREPFVKVLAAKLDRQMLASLKGS